MNKDHYTLCPPREIAHEIGLSAGEIASFANHGCQFYGDLTSIAWVREHIQQIADGKLPYIPFREAGVARKAIPISVRQVVLQRDDFSCHYCGSKGRLSMDHVIPYSKGGEDTSENLVAACLDCNIRRQTRPYEEFKKSVRFCIWPRITNCGEAWFQRKQRVDEIPMDQLRAAVAKINLPTLT